MTVPAGSMIRQQDIRNFEPNALLTADAVPLNAQVRGGLIQFARNTLGTARGPIHEGSMRALIAEIATVDAEYPIYSAQPFRYAATPDLPEKGITCSAESTVVAALANMRFMVSRFHPQTFAASASESRKKRAVQWRTRFDDNFEFRMRGGAGAGAFSIDLGLGIAPIEKPGAYNELWRTGIDTVFIDSQLGARFIRTGSGVKRGDVEKTQAFEQFRKTYGILPQRLLGILGLYCMRELNPDYALAMTTEGARRYSTLGKSSGTCDYSGIFTNIGFQPSGNPNWLIVEDFSTGFFESLKKARIRRRESDVLHSSVQSMRNMTAVESNGNILPLKPPIIICSDNSKKTIEKELGVYMRSTRR